MRQFIVFYFVQYYPGGGMNDCLGSFDSQEEVYASLRAEKIGDYQVVDRDTWKILEEGSIEDLFPAAVRVWNR